jgi:hypothetical protein
VHDETVERLARTSDFTKRNSRRAFLCARTGGHLPREYPAAHLGSEDDMATQKQKQAARRNLVTARAAQKLGGSKPKKAGSHRLSTAEQNDLPESRFAFPEQRKEPLTDAAHVRNAIARFDEVEDVSDADRAAAWKRIKSAANRFDVEVEARSRRDLMRGGKTKKQKK